MLDRAITLASKAHEGQTDKLGQPYILHPIHVMLAFEKIRIPELREKLMVVAILHDIVEDTNVTLQSIETNFGTEIADAIDAISKRNGETRIQYMDRVKLNDLAVLVKNEDMLHNSSPSRLHYLPEADVNRLTKKYEKGLIYIADAVNDACRKYGI